MNLTYEVCPIWFNFSKETLKSFSKLRLPYGDIYPTFMRRRENNSFDVQMRDGSKIIIVKDDGDIIAWAALFKIGSCFSDAYEFDFMVYVRKSHRGNRIATNCYKIARKIIGKRKMNCFNAVEDHIVGKRGADLKIINKTVQNYYRNKSDINF